MYHDTGERGHVTDSTFAPCRPKEHLNTIITHTTTTPNHTHPQIPLHRTPSALTTATLCPGLLRPQRYRTCCATARRCGCWCGRRRRRTSSAPSSASSRCCCFLSVPFPPLPSPLLPDPPAAWPPALPASIARRRCLLSSRRQRPPAVPAQCALSAVPANSARHTHSCT